MERRRRSRAVPPLGERLGLVAGVVAVFAVAAAGLVLGTTGGAFPVGSGDRSAEETHELLSRGDCAFRPDGTVVGRIVGSRGATRAFPRAGYLVATPERRRVVQVSAAEVRVAPCAPAE